MIRELLHAYGSNLRRQFAHDRLNTLGSSEAGRCARASAFAKLEVPPDPDFVEGWGAALRGSVIEDSFWVPGLRANLPPGATLLYAGEEQQTFVDGFLSATPDGLIVGVARDCLSDLGVPDIGQTSLLLDCKSIDPRANLRQPKPEHVFQMHVGMGLVRRATDHQPEYAILSYIDASFWDHITEFPVRFDPRVYDAAIERARSIMAATNPGDLAPEGKIAGGGECRYCAWGQQCVGTTLASMPPGGARLGANAAAELKSLRDAERALAASAEATEYTRAATQEAIKQFLRTAGVRGHKGDNWSVQWTVTKGRQSIDQAALLEAAADAGIQIDEFKKEGKPAERLTVT